MKIEKCVLKYLTDELRNGPELLSVMFQTVSVICLILQQADNSLMFHMIHLYIPDLILLLLLLHCTDSSTANIYTATIVSVVPK